MEKIKIDDREDEKFISEFLTQQIEYEVVHLEVADVVYKNICFERKTVEDFYGSVHSNRIFIQAMNMRENYAHRYILIIGDYRKLFNHPFIKNFRPNEYHAALCSLTARDEYDCKILQCFTNKEAIYLIMKIIEKTDCIEEQREVLRITSKKYNIKINILGCLPSISVLRARTVLDFFDVKVLLVRKTEITQLNSIKGFGQKISEKLRDLIEIR